MDSPRQDIAIATAESIATLLEENKDNRPANMSPDESYAWAVTVVRMFRASLALHQRSKRGRPRKTASAAMSIDVKPDLPAVLDRRNTRAET